MTTIKYRQLLIYKLASDTVSKWYSGAYLLSVLRDVWQKENRWKRKQHAIFTGKRNKLKYFFSEHVTYKYRRSHIKNRKKQ
jgi:hypothetical protein